jgi:CheY-like chemotaxis protein
VVNDEETARYVLRRCLTGIGCRVVEASRGEEALQRAASEPPDIIFLDLRMPDMLGTEVLARLKRDRTTAGIPVVIATSQPFDDSERRRLLNHAVTILSKLEIGGNAGTEAIRRAMVSAGLELRVP